MIKMTKPEQGPYSVPCSVEYTGVYNDNHNRVYVVYTPGTLFDLEVTYSVPCTYPPVRSMQMAQVGSKSF